MPRKSDTKSVIDNATVEQSTVATVKADAEIKEIKKVVATPLNDSDEIVVKSLVPNVSYLDKHTGDFYRWDVVGWEEPLTFETLKNMWRNHKGYFRNMWLRPLDDRVINRFGLEKLYRDFDFLMDCGNYTRANVNVILETISKTPNELKFTIVDRIKHMITSGELTDAFVIRALDKRFGVDFMSYL